MSLRRFIYIRGDGRMYNNSGHFSKRQEINTFCRTLEVVKYVGIGSDTKTERFVDDPSPPWSAPRKRGRNARLLIVSSRQMYLIVNLNAVHVRLSPVQCPSLAIALRGSKSCQPTHEGELFISCLQLASFQKGLKIPMTTADNQPSCFLTRARDVAPWYSSRYNSVIFYPSPR